MEGARSRSTLRNAMPSISGIRTSDNTTSGAATSSIASARWGPSATRTSVVPLSASASASEVRIVGSSSTIRRRRGIGSRMFDARRILDICEGMCGRAAGGQERHHGAAAAR